MSNSTMLGTVYILMACMILVGALLSRRERFARSMVLLIGWTGIFVSGFVVFTFRDDIGYLGQRLRAEATGKPVQVGAVLRVPMALDGHFWVEAQINGAPVRFLVDSGATMTTIDRETAKRAGISVTNARDQYVRTGNGMIRVATAIANRLDVETIQRQQVGLHISQSEEINVLGMNYLSSLQRWGVEGRWLVLQG
ncbi:MAG: TIGR02281 family clan AA aspartic protease [Sphingomicrobium sp.]